KDESARNQRLCACRNEFRRVKGVQLEDVNAEQQAELARDPLPLRGKSVVVTGVSRRRGIGYATACRLAAYGASVFCHHYSPHDQEQAWGGDDLDAVLDGLRGHLVGDARVADLHADLTEPGAPHQVVTTAATEFGRVDALICNQALSGSDGPIGELNA